MKTKRFTILHSNDMHGDFLAEVAKGGGKLIGGLALLSGYINKVRQEEENVLFVIAGDMVQGSLIDSEYKGISTIEIMNYLAPDVVALGNHEFDYGLPHLLFLEKMANFPIVNANLYVKKYNRRLMRPYIILKKAGMDILFTGIITEKVMDSLSMDKLVGSFVSLEEASAEVGKICDVYKNSDIDLTIALTHIGIESDIALAKMLKPEWGVDMIIGGHSHTLMEKPERINNILIAQAGTGTNQIGRFDIVVDDDTNSIVEWKWKAIAIDESIAKPDKKLAEYIQSFKSEVDRKYNTVVTKFSRVLTNPCREKETELGNVFADAFCARSQSDVMLVGSGSIRSSSLGPVVTLQDVMSCFTFDDSLIAYEITGIQLKKIFSHIMRKENRNSEGECYQVNAGVRAVYNDEKKQLTSLVISGEPVSDTKNYTVCMQGYHSNNSKGNLSISQEDLMKRKGATVVTTSAREVLIEYLRNNQNVKQEVEGRLFYI
jgi:5'-nucleotidase / UDP-sugar diphosphatase